MISFYTAAKLSFSVFSFPIEKQRFLCFLFVWAFFYIDLCSMFFCLFLGLEKMVSHFVSLSLFFLILLFNSVSLHYSIYMHPKLKMLLLSWKNVGKLFFCFWSLGLKNICAWKIRSVFPSHPKLLFPISSLFALNPQQIKQKNIIFCLCSVSFCFMFFNFFPSFLFHCCCLCSLSPFIFLFISFCFSPFSFLSFHHSFFFTISLFLFLFFSVSHVSLSVFLHRRFCVSSFCFNSFFFSSFFFQLLFFFISVSVLLPKQIQKFLWSTFFWRRNRVFDFLNPLFLRCFVSCCFSSLRRPLLVFSVSWCSFSWFSCINLLFVSRWKNVDLLLDNWVQKISFLFERNPCFLEFYHFCCRFVFACMISKKQFASFFQCLWKNLVSFVSISFCFCSKKKNTSKRSWFSLFYVFSLWCCSSYSPRFSFLFFSFFSNHVSSPWCLLSLCLSNLFLMFIYSLSFFLSLSLSRSYASSV